MGAGKGALELTKAVVQGGLHPIETYKIATALRGLYKNAKYMEPVMVHYYHIPNEIWYENTKQTDWSDFKNCDENLIENEIKESD